MSTRPRAVVGIAVHAQPARFQATLDAVRRTVPPGTGIVVIPDHPDAETAAALAADPSLRVLPAPDAPGGPACFNRLMGSTEAELRVLLESGCIPAPRWLDHLRAGLEADPRNGLAGPSTNRAWNEQGVEPGCPASEAAVASVGRRLEARRGGQARTLEPLHSLADFCYAVRREVWDALGAADEGFGAGPCWEMEYNARAARAGWRGVWVPAAFVWRAPFTPRRARAEQALFERSRRRYQDRLCGLRLRGERTEYEPHCRGDACEHFAPRELVQIRVDPRPPVPGPAPETVEAGPPRPRIPLPISIGRTAEPAMAPAAGEIAESAPLISCIMPTRGRPEFALQAIRYFQAQDYPARELIILDDEGGELGARLPDDPRIRYQACPPGESIGAKRNRGAELARGEIVAQWDDDDWYAPGRLSAQAAPILAGRADVTGLRAEVFFELDEWRFWTCTDALHRRLFVLDVHGGTLVYRRSVWGTRAVYPPASLAEDAAFLHRAVRGGARLQRIDTPGLFVYLRHGRNAWRFGCGRHVDPRGWRPTGEPPHLGPDRAFYAARSPAAGSPPEPEPVRVDEDRPAVREVRDRERPLVSCLMPTADRPRFVPRAIQHFLRQDYPHRELVIVDDGTEAVGGLVPDDPRIRYVRTERARNIGAKRNLACSLARGPLLAHWDDDDWMADDRLSRQVQALEDGRKEVCGLSAIRFFDPAAARAWEYRWRDPARPWLAGATLLFRRAAWERRAFPELQEGEDTRWIWSQPARAVLPMREPGWYAALVHPGNTSAKQTRGANWSPVALDVVRRAMGPDWAFYAALAPERALTAV